MEDDTRNEPFCACGRIISRCDRSRARCAPRLDFDKPAEQRRPTREDRRHRVFDREGNPMWVSVPA